MKMSDMLMKKWYKVQIIAKSKQFKVTKQVFNTKSEGIDKGISKGYEILNYKALSKLLTEGYTEYQTKSENITTEATQSENIKEVKQPWQPMFIVGDEQIEKQIAEYTNKKMQKKGVQFVTTKGVKDGLTDAEKQFLSTPPKQQKHEPLKVDKYALTDKQYHSNVNAVKRQREEYCSL